MTVQSMQSKSAGRHARRSVRPWLFLAAALVPLVGHCGEVEVTVSGHYARGFEFSELVPCGEQEGWWFSGTDEFYRRYDALVGEPLEQMAPPITVYVRVTGVRTGPGSFGHLAAWRYKFRATKVEEVRRPTPHDCKQ